jgi:hypothetical protein
MPLFKRKIAPADEEKSTPEKGKGRPVTRQCGLCGKRGKLMKTPCCGQWICDDYDSYVMFSYATNSCHRNHDRYTACSFHFNEGHEGDWQECQKCPTELETEMYVWYATNEYNFVKLANPPKFKPTKCTKCKRVIKLAEGGYSMKGGKYYCWKCSSF